jgi:hypothetical protein
MQIGVRPLDELLSWDSQMDRALLISLHYRFAVKFAIAGH